MRQYDHGAKSRSDGAPAKNLERGNHRAFVYVDAAFWEQVSPISVSRHSVDWGRPRHSSLVASRLFKRKLRSKEQR